MTLDRKTIVTFLTVIAPSILTFLTTYYVDGEGIKQGLSSDFQKLHGMATPFFISLLVAAFIWLFIRQKEQAQEAALRLAEQAQANAFLMQQTKNAYLWAWVANHFDLRGGKERPDGTRPILFKCFDSHIHKFTEIHLNNDEFNKAMAYLGERYDKNQPGLTPEDLVVFENQLLKGTLFKTGR